MKICILGLLLLSACATPVTSMQKGDSVVTCGGDREWSIIGGVSGYHYQRSKDLDCVTNYSSQGYVVTKP